MTQTSAPLRARRSAVSVASSPLGSVARMLPAAGCSSKFETMHALPFPRPPADNAHDMRIAENSDRNCVATV